MDSNSGGYMDKSIAVLGMGRFGRYIAEQLSFYGADLMIVDGDSETVNQLSSLASTAVSADLTDTDAIKALGLADMDIVVVTMGSSLEASVMCTMIAKELGVPRVIAKAASDRMGEILKRVGADEIIYPEKEVAFSTARKILSSNFLEYYNLDDDLCVVRMKPRAEWVGKTLANLRLRNQYDVNVVTIQQKNAPLSTSPDPNLPIAEDATLLVVAKKKDLRHLS